MAGDADDLVVDVLREVPVQPSPEHQPLRCHSLSIVYNLKQAYDLKVSPPHSEYLTNLRKILVKLPCRLYGLVLVVIVNSPFVQLVLLKTTASTTTLDLA